jgi:transposase
MENKKRQTRVYTEEFKVEAVKLAREIGQKNAAEKLNIPSGTLGHWTSDVNMGRKFIGEEYQTAKGITAQTIRMQEMEEELRRLRKENAKLKEEREVLAEATAFFAASRRK